MCVIPPVMVADSLYILLQSSFPADWSAFQSAAYTFLTVCRGTKDTLGLWGAPLMVSFLEQLFPELKTNMMLLSKAWQDKCQFIFWKECHIFTVQYLFDNLYTYWEGGGDSSFCSRKIFINNTLYIKYECITSNYIIQPAIIQY